MTLLSPRAAALLVVLSTIGYAGPAAAQSAAATTDHRTTPIVDLPGPGGALGINGFDVFNGQAVAQRFTVPATGDFRLARVGLYLMNNSDTDRRHVSLSVQTDALDEGGTQTMPSGHILESWGTRVEALGWSPTQQFFDSTRGSRLHAGRNYWVVAASRAQGGADPVWVLAKRGSEVGSLNPGDAWYAGVEQGALTLRVDAAPIVPR